MSATPLISIITPCYNAEKTISQTVESVLGQSYQDWELLIIDDGSSDESRRIISEYEKKDKRIKLFVLEKSSGSPSLPRNIGIDNAKGDYIAFLDADDLWLPEKLANQIKFMEEKNIKFSYSDYEKINNKGERSNRVVKMPKESSFWDVIETCTIPCLTVVLKRVIIGETRFKPIAKEDFAFWLDILKKDVIAYNTGSVLALYREQPQSRSSNKIQMIKDQWHLLRQVEGVKLFVASYFMMKYLFYGIIKYLK